MAAEHSSARSEGEQIEAVYLLRADDVEAAKTRARAIGVEQTVEFPPELIATGTIPGQMIGEVETIEQVDEGHFAATIGYPPATAGSELTQLINVLFGNISIEPGVRLLDFRLPDGLARQFRGPRFGIDGLRALIGVYDRPLLCTAIKPMGLSPGDLADLSYQLALGGIDLIKDDHGLSDQAICPFEERVARCTAAVQRANLVTGQRCLYLPNVTGPFPDIGRRARFARDHGAGGLLFCPGLAGLDSMRALADDDRLALPILSHPAFQGSYAASTDAGLSHRVLFGLLNRLAGADGTIFPSYGGRFAYSQAQCREVVAGATEPMASLRPIFPVPAGGMRLARIDELVRFYGRDCMLLIGGDLHAQGPDLVRSCSRFKHLTTDAAAAMAAAHHWANP